MRSIRVCLVLTLILSQRLFGGSVCFKIDRLPKLTPPKTKLFVSGNFNDWHMSSHELVKTHDGKYELCIDTSLDTINFKFHRGNWSMVEATGVGGQMSDRKLGLLSHQTISYAVHIEGWEDIAPDKTVRIFVVDNTGTTPANSKLYVSGNFSGWYPDRKDFELQNIVGSKYIAEIPVFDDSIFYKYTRGSWDKVEGEVYGGHRGNRYLTHNGSGEYYDTIQSWEDLQQKNKYQFIIDEIPENTPKDAKLYLSGSMNNWTTEDTSFRLQQKNGRYSIQFFSSLDTIAFKVNRGDWTSVEGSINGLARKNRIVIFDRNRMPLHLEIKSWEDINVQWFNLYTMSLIIPVVIGVLLLLALNGLKHQQLANTYLQLTLVFLCFCLVFRVLTYYRGIFNWYPQLIVLSDAIYFLFGPSLFMYVKALIDEEGSSVKSLIRFVPFLIFVVAYIYFFTIPHDKFILGILNQHYKTAFALTGIIGLGVNLYYWISCYQLNLKYQMRVSNHLSYSIKNNYLQYILSLSAIVLFFWFMVYLCELSGKLFAVTMTNVSNTLIDLCWFTVSSFIYLFGFFAIQKPEIFKNKAPAESTAKDKELWQEMDTLSKSLATMMKFEKLFLNSSLSLQDLANELGTSVHLISKVINEGSKMNFYDYINALRIKEFIERVNNGESEHKTFLAIAYEVGFSSKSTFNRAFKKLEKLTPREYFKSMAIQKETIKL